MRFGISATSWIFPKNLRTRLRPVNVCAAISSLTLSNRRARDDSPEGRHQSRPSGQASGPLFTRFGLPPNRPVAAAGGGNHVAATHMAGYHRRWAQIWAIPGNAYPGTAELPSQLLE